VTVAPARCRPCRGSAAAGCASAPR
jgi:hypothetical protein